MHRELRKDTRAGFTLIELLVVVAVIGIISALLVPNLLDALQKAKQKKTMAAVRDLGVHAMSVLTDGLGAAAAGLDVFTWPGTDCEVDCINLFPDPDTVGSTAVVCNGGWGEELEVAMDVGLCDFSSGSLPTRAAVAVRSCGRDGVCDAEYIVGTFPATDYDEDIVWANGYFVRRPERPE